MNFKLLIFSKYLTAFFQKKINPRNQITQVIVVILVLAAVSLIPLLKTYGRLNIGSDTFIPPIPENSYKMTFEWIGRNNGEYISNSYNFWVPILHLLKLSGMNIYQVAFFYQFLIFFLSGLGIYKIYNLVNKNKPFFGLISAVFFIYSPHLLDHLIYYLGTVSIVWITYVVIKFIVSKKLTFGDCVLASFMLGIITDLPNPKYHFLLFLLIFLAVLLALLLKLLNLKDIRNNLKYFMLASLMTTYLTLPFLYFGYSFFKTQKIPINIKLDYKTTGVALDYGVALISRMIKLFHTPYGFINIPDYFIYFSVPLIVLGLFPFIIIRLTSYKKRVYIIFYSLALFFIFLAKGSNPPFGFIYDYILNSSSLFVFMRTTAGIVIFAAVFYALIFGKTFEYLILHSHKRGLIISIMIAIMTIIGYPYWSGRYFLNRSPVNSYINRKEYGLIIPPEYFKSANFLKGLRLDSKVDIYPMALNYQNNNWGYFGFIIYPWMIDQPTIAFDKTTLAGQINSSTNAMYILHDKSLEADYSSELFWQKPEKLIFQSKLIDIYRKKAGDFLPHFYAPRQFIFSGKMTPDLLKRKYSDKLAVYDFDTPFEAIKMSNQNLESQLSIEYSKINATKYRIIIHKTKEPFIMIFTENFDEEWKLYLQKAQDYKVDKSKISNYAITPVNVDDQATKQEVIDFMKKGWLSTLGEKFISKNFQGTIQNDNLPNKDWYETFIETKQLKDIPHLKVDGYANSWIIDPKKICKNEAGTKCNVNPDGSYDVELVAEFWPQRLANLSWFISLSTLFFCLVIIGIKKIISLRPKP